ncbi:Dothistromin biosynthesis peroxidase dotB [Pseudocercospora fuligena]|uniref:Dothistromin biosynthesis peroxidase dotB n=1 Tax=Pseudocercospora fuligena TaxID=685502 RepID=A0A8H6VIG7_9PEZI|nr:Dothistromin biosynthesis peroxidase dotB [Pseudocercospora fuligena]
MKTTLLLAGALGASAFPHLKRGGEDLELMLRDLYHNEEKRGLMTRDDYLGISKAESNCGTRACPTFDPKDQLVSVSGEHVWAAPGPGDIRGPCPGLNAAANHGYLPRNGIASIEQTVSGLGAAYNLGPRISAVLAAYAIAVDGNVVEGVWSIGGPLPTDELTGAILGTGQGLSYSHNNYEGDSSIGRGDAYINNGDAHSLNVTRFEQVYNIAVKDGSDRYTLDKFRSKFEEAQDESIANNPYYFTGAFSTVVVVPAAYNFVINLMSNHSAEQPAGYLDGYNFKSFFGVAGEPGNFQWLKGQERIPEHWYRRPSYAPYEAQDVVGDVAIGYLAYPNTLKFGGNTGKVNTFTGLNVANISGGVLSASTLFSGDNFACFAFQLLQQAIPDFLNNAVNDLAPITSLVNKYVGPIVGGLSCPQLGKLDVGLFDQFPGYKYKPTGPDTNY